MYHVEWHAFDTGDDAHYHNIFMLTEDEKKEAEEMLKKAEANDGAVLDWEIYEISKLCDFDDLLIDLPDVDEEEEGK
jgi:hypothetical protein